METVDIETTEDSDNSENSEVFKLILVLPVDPTSCGSDISPVVGNDVDTFSEETVTILDDDSKCSLL